MIDQEYHAFGPWIYEINNAHPMPPLFVPYFKEGDNYLKLVKIPRNIDRSAARPGMDLYDYVIGMYEDYIYILKRTNAVVEENKVLYRDIDGIEILFDLLHGTLTIYWKDSKVVVYFNTSSADIIMQLTKIIRDRYTENTVIDIKGQDFNKKINVDDLYKNQLAVMKSEDDSIKISAVQPSLPVELKKGGFLERVQHLIFGRMLLNTLHLSNNKELIILSRGKAFKKRNIPNYAYVTHTYR